VLPSAARLDSAQSFAGMQSFFDCGGPAAGELILVAPAVAALNLATGEYVLTQKGQLEVLREEPRRAAKPPKQEADGSVVEGATDAVGQLQSENSSDVASLTALSFRPALQLIGVLLLVALIPGGLIWLFHHAEPPATASVPDQSFPSPKPRPRLPKGPEGMVFVPGGELRMGTDQGDEYERPAHRVMVEAFFIDRTEVTCESYQKFMTATGRAAPPGWGQQVCPPSAARWPVTGVTWDDAEAYARWARKRLPTEAEWEFAARGGDGRRYPWGNEWRAGYANAGDTTRRQLAEVGSYPQGASPFGVLDLAGNAWEWTADDLAAYPGGRLPKGITGTGWKVMRGGAWNSDPPFVTTTYRRGYPARGTNEYVRIGFRCAQSVELGKVRAG